jgi:hypothetical protein
VRRIGRRGEREERGQAGDRGRQQREHPFLPAEAVDGRTERDPQQRTGQVRHRDQERGCDRTEREQIAKAWNEGPEDRDAGEPAEKGERRQCGRLAPRPVDRENGRASV